MKRRTCSKFALIGTTIGAQAKEPPSAEDVSFTFGYTKDSVESVCTVSNELFTSRSDVECLTSNRLLEETGSKWRAFSDIPPSVENTG